MKFDTVWQDREDAARLRRSLPLVTTDCARLGQHEVAQCARWGPDITYSYGPR